VHLLLDVWLLNQKVGRCVIGLEKPTHGRIRFQNEYISEKRNVRSKDIRGKIQLTFSGNLRISRS
jgi:ABC-type oligopeptide transport system ATPase subunit